MARKVTFKVNRVTDPDFENSYGGCFQAVANDGWEGALRSTEARAVAEGEAHVASLAPADDEPDGDGGE